MTSRIKLGMKLIKYTFDLKGNIVLMVLFTILGILWFFFTEMNLFGPLYLAIIGVYAHQMLNTLQYSDMVLSSPREKELQISVTLLLSILCGLSYYMLTILVTVLDWKLFHQEGYSFRALVVFGGVFVFMMIYEVLWPKMGTIMMFLSILIAFIPAFLAYTESGSILLEGISLGAGVGIGLAEILLGAVLQYLAARLTYRLPVSNKMMLARLQRYR